MRRHAKASSAGSSRATGANRGIFAIALSALALLLAFAAPGAQALQTHKQVGDIDSTGTPNGFQSLAGLAVQQSGGDLYAVDDFGGPEGVGAVDRFNNTGAFQSPQITGAATPQTALAGPADVAVDESGGGSDGNVYVADTFNNLIDAFDDSGNLVTAFATNGQLDGTATPAAAFSSPCGVAVDQTDGDLFVGDSGNNRIWIFDETGAYLGRIADGTLNGPCGLALDSSGDLYVRNQNLGNVVKFSREGPVTYVFAAVIDPNSAAGVAVGATDVAVDPSNDHVYVDDFNQVTEYDASGSQVSQFGNGTIGESFGIAVDGASGKVYVSDRSSLHVFGPLVTLPDVLTTAATGITPGGGSGTLNGTVNPSGVELTECEFEYGAGEGYGETVPCAEATAAIGGGNEPVPVHADLIGLAPGGHHFRLVAANANGSIKGTDQSFRTAGVPTITEVAADSINDTTAKLAALINPETLTTSYRFEYGTDTSYGTVIPPPASQASAGSGSTPTLVAEDISGLRPGTTYHFRVVAINASGEAGSPDQSFTTLADHVTARGYELVSPADDESYDAGELFHDNTLSEAPGARLITPEGRCATYTLSLLGTPKAIPGMQIDGDAVDPAVACRTADGWVSRSPGGDRSDCVYNGTLLFPPGQNALSADLSVDGNRSLVSVYCEGDRLDFSGGLDQQPGTLNNVFRAGVWGVDRGSGAIDYPTGAYGVDGASVPRTDEEPTSYLGGSADLHTIYFLTGGPLLPGVPDSNSSASSYLWRHDGGTDGTTTLITQTAAGVPVPYTPNEESHGRLGTVSVDGSAVTFDTEGQMVGDGVATGDLNSVEDVYQVRNGQVTWVSKPAFTGPAQAAAPRVFNGASSNGQRSVFSTTEKMVGNGTTTGDLDTVKDLYVYAEDAPAGQELSQISVDDPSCTEAAPGTCNDDASDGASAGNNGSAANFSTISADGTHVFFTSGDVLNPLDTDGQESLYVRDLATGKTEYIVGVGGGVSTNTDGVDSGTGTNGSLVFDENGGTYGTIPISVSNDGTVAAFSLGTYVALPADRGGADADGVSDIYIWTQAGGPTWQKHLRRVRQGLSASTNTATPPALGCVFKSAYAGENCRKMTADGSEIYVQTTDSLASADTDHGVAGGGADPCEGGTGCDVYGVDTKTGDVTLISPPGSSSLNSTFVAVSESGEDLFFQTGETLDSSRDIDRGHLDIYDARTGPIFPPAPGPTECISGDACQGPASNAPPEPSPESASHIGPGNPTPVYRHKRKRHKTAHHKKKHHKKHHTTRKHG